MEQKLSRKELYDLVWLKPLVQLAKEFGLSDNGLRKICKKYDIPLPKMGHWQKVQFGKKVEKEKLGNSENWNKIKISIRESEAHNEEHNLTKVARVLKEIEKVCSNLLPVPEILSKPHPLVKEAKVNLDAKKKKTSWRNLPECIYTDRHLLSICVQKHNVTRTLLIMDTFIKMAERREHKIIIDHDGTKLIVNGEKFGIRFREKHTRQDVSNERWSSTENVPNDKLSIKYDYYLDKEWADKGILLENQLPRIIAFFEIRSIEIKEQREQSRIAQEEADRKREKERKFKALKEWELKKQEILITASQTWRKAEDLKQFITKIEQSNQESVKTKEWLNWANLKLIELDPLSHGIDSFISQFDLPEHLRD